MLIKKYVYHLHSRDAAAPSLASAWQLLFMRCLLNFHFLNEISATRGRRRGWEGTRGVTGLDGRATSPQSQRWRL